MSKYEVGKCFKIQSLEGIKYYQTFVDCNKKCKPLKIENCSDCGNDLGRVDSLHIGDIVKIQRNDLANISRNYVLELTDETVSDFLTEKDLDIMLGDGKLYDSIDDIVKEINGKIMEEVVTKKIICNCTNCGKNIYKGDIYCQVKLLGYTGEVAFVPTCSKECAVELKNEYIQLHEDRANEIRNQEIQNMTR